MRVIERATPIAAVVAALSSLACCLPFAFIGAIGFAGVSAHLQAVRPWLLVLSGVLLVVGFLQLHYKRRCQPRSRLSVAIFWIATAVVLLLVLFPELIASVIAR